jgi:UDPglucose 6-dehydrogenase
MPASERHALVMKSTVLCGTGATIQRGFGDGGGCVSYVSRPSSLLRARADVTQAPSPGGAVGDDGGWAGDAAVVAELRPPASVYRHRQRAMIKSANAFRRPAISFINETRTCEDTAT